jgi:hypothetical protein
MNEQAATIPVSWPRAMTLARAGNGFLPEIPSIAHCRRIFEAGAPEQQLLARAAFAYTGYAFSQPRGAPI